MRACVLGAAFLLQSCHSFLGARRHARPVTSVAPRAAAADKVFTVEVELEQGPVKVQLSPTMAKSEVVVAKYPLPFFIDIEARKEAGNVVTKDGSEQKNDGAERVGDRLRAFTYYEVGSNVGGGGGAIDMFASFGGVGIKYQRKLFDATFVPWEKALETLCTNEPRRTDSVTMVFERPVDE
mmetsp:Transcript_29110/g.87007  ORF Transcript_29110/g.87007 Transcript_29110/m.87007 type:complete len:181 (+) Transcript_29110:191-733(+)